MNRDVEGASSLMVGERRVSNSTLSAVPILALRGASTEVQVAREFVGLVGLGSVVLDHHPCAFHKRFLVFKFDELSEPDLHAKEVARNDRH